MILFRGSSVRLERMCTLHQEMGEEEENGVKADSAADDNSQLQQECRIGISKFLKK